MRYLLPPLPISVISPCHPSIYPPHPYPSMGISIPISLEEDNYVNTFNLCTWFLSCLSFILVQVLYLSALFFQNPPWLVGRRPFVFSFVSLRFTLRYLDFLHFGFDSSRFSSLCYLSECVVLVLSRFGGTFVVLFVLAFVSVGVSASGRKENRKRTPIEIHKTHSVPFFIPRR